jgi:hypothetical protein
LEINVDLTPIIFTQALVNQKFHSATTFYGLGSTAEGRGNLNGQSRLLTDVVGFEMALLAMPPQLYQAVCLARLDQAKRRGRRDSSQFRRLVCQP